MKLCKDCNHYQGKAAVVECLCPGNQEHPDYTGEPEAKGTFRWQTAQACRVHDCGPEAKWFEAKS